MDQHAIYKHLRCDRKSAIFEFWRSIGRELRFTNEEAEVNKKAFPCRPARYIQAFDVIFHFNFVQIKRRKRLRYIENIARLVRPFNGAPSIFTSNQRLLDHRGLYRVFATTRPTVYEKVKKSIFFKLRGLRGSQLSKMGCFQLGEK